MRRAVKPDGAGATGVSRGATAPRAIRLLAALWVLGLLPPRPAAADLARPGGGRTAAASFGIELGLWNFDTGPQVQNPVDAYTQVAMPIAYAMPVGERMTVDVLAHPFRSDVSPVVGSLDPVSHLGDLLLRGSYLVDEGTLATLSIGVPTGKTELDLEELGNAALASLSPLNNPIQNFGTGWVVNGSIAVARSMGKWAVGLGAAYSYRAEYDLADTLVSYNPGDELNLTVGADRNFELRGRPAQTTLDLVYTFYTDDQAAGATVFEVGNKLLFEGRLLFPVGPVDPWITTLRVRKRADSKLANLESIDNGAEIELGATARFPAGERRAVDLIGGVRHYGGVGDAGEATLLGLGFGLHLPLGTGIALEPALLVEFGEIDDVSVTGIRLRGGVSYRPRTAGDHE